MKQTTPKGKAFLQCGCELEFSLLENGDVQRQTIKVCRAMRRAGVKKNDKGLITVSQLNAAITVTVAMGGRAEIPFPTSKE